MAQRPRKQKIKCRGPRDEDGRACQRRVSQPGQRCPQHIGRPEVPLRGRLSEYAKRPAKKAKAKASPRVRRDVTAPRPGRTSSQSRSRRSGPAREVLVAEAVDYFQATVTAGAVDAAAAQAARYGGDQVWARLTNDWSGRNCKGLARLARAALEGKDWLHGWVGDLVGLLLEFLGTPHVVRIFGKEIARRIPLPWDRQLVVVSRGMQIAGIAVCLINGRDLAKCECFIDVVVNEGKERVRQLMELAAKDWRNLEQLVPAA